VERVPYQFTQYMQFLLSVFHVAQTIICNKCNNRNMSVKVKKIRFIYIAPQLAHMAPQRHRGYRQRQHTAEAAAQAHIHRLWPIAIQPHIALVCCLMGSTSVIHVNIWIASHFYQPCVDRRLSWPSWLTHSRQSCQLPTIDWA